MRQSYSRQEPNRHQGRRRAWARLGCHACLVRAQALIQKQRPSGRPPDGSDVRLYSKSGADQAATYAQGLRRISHEVGRDCDRYRDHRPRRQQWRSRQGAVADRPEGVAHFYRLMHQMRTRWPEEGLLVFLALDLLHQDGVDVRILSLSERKRDLAVCAPVAHFLPQARRDVSRRGGPSTIATNSGLRVSFPSAGRRATRAARADGAPSGRS